MTEIVNRRLSVAGDSDPDQLGDLGCPSGAALLSRSLGVRQGTEGSVGAEEAASLVLDVGEFSSP